MTSSGSGVLSRRHYGSMQLCVTQTSLAGHRGFQKALPVFLSVYAAPELPGWEPVEADSWESLHKGRVPPDLFSRSNPNIWADAWL